MAATRGMGVRRPLRIGTTAVGIAVLWLAAPAYGEARITPSTVDFGVQPQGRQSAPVVVELMNVGQNTFRVYRAEVNSGPDNADFVVVGDGCSGLDLAPQGRCPLEVAFKPTGVGLTSQTVGIDVSGPDYRTFGERAAVVTLTGIGDQEGAAPTTQPLPPPGERTTAPVPLGLFILVAGVGALGLGFFLLATTPQRPVSPT
jgi:hypothetical protein